MFTINKTLVATAAVVAVGLVAAIDFAQSRTQLSPAAVVAARFPASSEMMMSVSIGQPAQPRSGAHDASPAPENCVREHWPYLADECLTATDGEQRKRQIRTIPIERRIVDDRLQNLHVASR